MTDEEYVRFLGRYFFASGHDREDIEQTARLGMLQSGHRNGGRRDVLDLVKVANRRRFETLPFDRADPLDLSNQVEARILLRRVLREIRNRNEQIAVGRVLRGEPIRRDEKVLQSALLRFRRRMGF